MENNQEQAITNFRGFYSFLSNFFNVKVSYRGHTFHNSEAAFQAAKCPDLVEDFTRISGRSARELGRHLPIRPDWEQVKEQVMYEVCLAKFTQNKHLAEALLATGDRMLAEENYWNDTEWGICAGVGQNKLGKILMRIRDEIHGSNLHKVKAHIHSLGGVMAEVVILDDLGHCKYIVVYDGVKCSAIFNGFVQEYYADDLYGVIKENDQDEKKRA